MPNGRYRMHDGKSSGTPKGTIEMKVMRILDDVAKCISEGQLHGAVRHGNANVIGQFILLRERFAA